MSIIIASKINGHVAMMCDSAESTGARSGLLTEKERYKIIKIGDVLVGSAGSVKNIRRLVEHPEWFDTDGEEFDKRFIVTKIIPRLYDDLSRHNLLETKDGAPQSNASVIMARGDRIFHVDHYFAVYEADSFAAAGCTYELIRPFLLDMKPQLGEPTCHIHEKGKMLNNHNYHFINLFIYFLLNTALV